MTTTTPAPRVTTTGSAAALPPRRTITATIAAVAVNLIVLAVARSAGVSMDAGNDEPVAVAQVVLSSLVPLGLGFVVVALAARRWPRLRRPAAWAGLALALVSVAAPVAAAADTGTAVSLALMHVVVGAAWFTVVRPRRVR